MILIASHATPAIGTERSKYESRKSLANQTIRPHANTAPPRASLDEVRSRSWIAWQDLNALWTNSALVTKHSGGNARVRYTANVSSILLGSNLKSRFLTSGLFLFLPKGSGCLDFSLFRVWQPGALVRYR
jgi:hypothetical protein